MTDAIISLALDAIELRNRLRPVDEATVFSIAASFGEQGQQQPIIVRPSPDGGNRMRLVAGAHRVCAARYLGWETIKAIVREASEDEARLAEIDENLMRRELSALDRAVFLAERKAAYLRLHPETGHGGARRPKNDPSVQVANIATFQRFTKDAAKKTGLSERSIQYAAGLIQRLTPEAIELLRSTPLADNGAALKELSRIADRDDQMAVVRLIAAGEAKTLKSAMAATGQIPVEEAVDPAIADRQRRQAKFEAWLARSDAKDRRAAIITILKHARTGEMPALINGLSEALPITQRQKLYTALRASLDGYLNEKGEVA